MVHGTHARSKICRQATLEALPRVPKQSRPPEVCLGTSKPQIHSKRKDTLRNASDPLPEVVTASGRAVLRPAREKPGLAMRGTAQTKKVPAAAGGPAAKSGYSFAACHRSPRDRKGYVAVGTCRKERIANTFCPASAQNRCCSHGLRTHRTLFFYLMTRRVQTKGRIKTKAV